MIPLCNMHTHTTYCDGKNTPEEMIAAAIDRGMYTIGFSGHAPADLWNHETWCMNEKQKGLCAYREELFSLKQKYASQIEVVVGLELDYYSVRPDWAEYSIGSVHQLKVGGTEIPVDLEHGQLCHKVQEVYGGDFMKFAKDFYALTADVANRTGCDIVGHFDLLTKFNEKYHDLDESDPAYRAMAIDALDAVMEKDVLFEINTGAISRGWRTTPYPAPFLLRRIAEKKGRVILNSDAHSADALLCAFEESVAYARSCGLDELWIYRNGGFQAISIKDGLS